jgi:hypothetical protein
MHKLSKGLKKKIKGKKGKEKEDDLFDPAVLENYRRQKAAEAAAAAEAREHQQPATDGSSPTEADEEGAAAAPEAETAKQPEESDEWRKFRLLTSGDVPSNQRRL